MVYLKAIQAQEQKASKRGSKKDAINEKKVEKNCIRRAFPFSSS